MKSARKQDKSRENSQHSFEDSRGARLKPDEKIPGSNSRSRSRSPLTRAKQQTEPALQTDHENTVSKKDTETALPVQDAQLTTPADLSTQGPTQLITEAQETQKLGDEHNLDTKEFKLTPEGQEGLEVGKEASDVNDLMVGKGTDEEDRNATQQEIHADGPGLDGSELVPIGPSVAAAFCTVNSQVPMTLSGE